MGEKVYYQAVRETLASKPVFIPYPSKIPAPKKDKDQYVSLFQYDQTQKELAETNGTVSGITATTTDKLYFDFDSKTDLSKAKEDSLTLVNRLVQKYNVDPDHIHASFTGCKGFSVELRLAERISNPQFKAAVQKLAGDLSTFDHVVSDPNRIVRVDNTRHQVTGNYKVPLELYELDELSIVEIVERSKSPRTVSTVMTPVKLDADLFKFVEKKKEKQPVTGDVKTALETKPRHWKDYKWALVQGFFEPGERHTALMIIAATCRGLGYDKNTAYYMCKSALKKQAERTSTDEFPKEELWDNIIENSVYSDTWEGGQFSPATNPWLAKYCERMGFESDQKEESEAPSITLTDMSVDFGRFSKDFEKNILKTGIKELDENATLTVSTLNGLLGQPGAGKTSMAINYLRNTSMAGIGSMFFSLDMGKQIVYSKLVQKITGLDFKESINMYREDPRRAQEVADKLQEEYKNVGFNFRSGTSVADIRRAIKEQEAQTGQKVKLVVVDYLECLQSTLSDPTAGAGQIAGQLKDVANEEEVCILLLLQTQKHSTPDIGDPLLSLKQVKGSSVVEQSCSTILTLWREGYSPKYANDDKYISFAVVKNRFGGLWSGDFAWNGLRGDIRSLTEEEHDNLKSFRRRKKEEKMANEAAGNKAWE